MGLNTTKGNMYDFITHTFNTVKGKCPHLCNYCYMCRWGELREPRLDRKEFKTDLGANNFIFVGSSIDLFAKQIPESWIIETLDYLDKFDNKYLLQSKNPERILHYSDHNVFKKAVACTTIETNRFYKEWMGDTPTTEARALSMARIREKDIPTFVTIEPILDFDVWELVRLIQICKPDQINIGADSGGHKMTEPNKEKILELIDYLDLHTKINQKRNIQRLLK